jgi:translation initiation factor IF-1
MAEEVAIELTDKVVELSSNAVFRAERVIDCRRLAHVSGKTRLASNSFSQGRNSRPVRPLMA